jgi:hypothetical protein
MSKSLPKLGDPVTYSAGSDRYPATVIYISPTGHEVWIQSDDSRCISGNSHNSEQQEWEYTQNPNGGILKCRWSLKRHRWMSDGARGVPVAFGHRERYNDPCF